MLLHAINPEVPPAFGDLVSVGDDHVEFANCGAGSLFWAANSREGARGLPPGEGRGQHPRPVGRRVRLLRRGSAPRSPSAGSPASTAATTCSSAPARSSTRGRFSRGSWETGSPRHLAGTWGKVIVDLGVKAYMGTMALAAMAIMTSRNDSGSSRPNPADATFRGWRWPGPAAAAGCEPAAVGGCCFGAGAGVSPLAAGALWRRGRTRESTRRVRPWARLGSPPQVLRRGMERRGRPRVALPAVGEAAGAAPTGGGLGDVGWDGFAAGWTVLAGAAAFGAG